MSRHYTQAEADAHNALTEKGWAILNHYILLLDREPKRIGFFGKRRLRKAITFFHEALHIAPDKYSSKWALGKIHQALGEHAQSLQWFEEACLLEQGNADVFREASLAAMDCSDFIKALDFSDKALEIRPEDAGLHCNRALALVFLDEDTDALAAVEASLALDPQDKITLYVRRILQSVVNGERPRPKTMKEI